MRHILVTTLALALGLFAAPGGAAEIRVAVASNFKASLTTLAPDFEAQTGHRLILSGGATGLLFAQITQGAPYDVFLAADVARPRALIDQGLALGPAPLIYATGRLALVFRSERPEGSPPDLSGVKTLSMANPRTAPYGRAAQQALSRLPAKGFRIAQAGNIAGVSAALQIGAVDAGFVARALLPAEMKAMAWTVPDDWHEPIDQGAVILSQAKDPKAARLFLSWLIRPDTKARIARMGYDVD